MRLAYVAYVPGLTLVTGHFGPFCFVANDKAVLCAMLVQPLAFLGIGELLGKGKLDGIAGNIRRQTQLMFAFAGLTSGLLLGIRFDRTIRNLVSAMYRKVPGRPTAFVEQKTTQLLDGLLSLGTLPRMLGAISTDPAKPKPQMPNRIFITPSTSRPRTPARNRIPLRNGRPGCNRPDSS